MDFEHELGSAAERFDDCGPHAEIGDEVAIHDVNVEPIGAAACDGGGFLAEPGEVSRED
jgi:hypothetical protein